MSDEDKSSKTEEATQKKKDEALEQGNFAKSPELGVVFVLSAAFIVIAFCTKGIARKLGAVSANIFDRLGDFEVTQISACHLLTEKFESAFLMVLPLIISCLVAALAAGVMQSGMKLTPKVIEPKFSKLNPVEGLKKLFGFKSVVQAGADILKFIAVGFVVYGALKEIMSHPIFRTPVAEGYIAEFLLKTIIVMLIRLIIALMIIGVINYIYQRYRVSKDLMMTKQEVKDERKQQEGSPLVKQAQRAMARRIMQKQMLDDVPLADVVVTNPTHYAVALKYESGKDPAPMVLAKGDNMFARRIKAIAAKNGVPMVENKPVARILYRIGKVGDVIPSSLYRVIAEILSEVYKTHKYYFHQLKSRRHERERQLNG